MMRRHWRLQSGTSAYVAFTEAWFCLRLMEVAHSLVATWMWSFLRQRLPMIRPVNIANPDVDFKTAIGECVIYHASRVDDWFWTNTHRKPALLGLGKL